MTSKRVKCPSRCLCICHDTQGAVTSQHGDNGRCPTKDGLALQDLVIEWNKS